MVGTLSQNQQGIFFQYNENYLAHSPSLSPFQLPFNNAVHQCHELSHKGLFGVFADSLPDGWGTLLMDRVFRQHQIEPYQISPLDRLAYIGCRALGALEYEPQIDSFTQSAQQANFTNWQEARHKINEIIEQIQSFSNIAQQLGVAPKTIKMISNYHNQL